MSKTLLSADSWSPIAGVDEVWVCRIAIGLDTPSSWIASVVVTRPVLDVLDEEPGAAGALARIRVQIGSATKVETLERTNWRAKRTASS